MQNYKGNLRKLSEIQRRTSKFFLTAKTTTPLLRFEIWKAGTLMLSRG